MYGTLRVYIILCMNATLCMYVFGLCVYARMRVIMFMFVKYGCYVRMCMCVCLSVCVYTMLCVYGTL